MNDVTSNTFNKKNRMLSNNIVIYRNTNRKQNLLMLKYLN